LSKHIVTQVASDQQIKLVLQPNVGELTNTFVHFCRRLVKSLGTGESQRGEVLERFKEKLKSTNGLTTTAEVDLLFVESVILDLVSQDWELTVRGSRVEMVPPTTQDDSLTAKDRVRRGHLLGRDAQLKEASVAEFITGMERRRLTPKGWHSIFSLMRDGKDLADRLRNIPETHCCTETNTPLSEVISPYIQFVEGDATCLQTGLRLGDVWRYFRHTWVNEYKSIPGRSIMILIRDAAAPNHPVIGIAALGSSVVQHSVRDRWIGWHPKTFTETLVKNPTAKIAKWLLSSVDALIEGTYQEDLRRERVIKSADISNPSETVIKWLNEESASAIKRHRRNPQKEIHKVAKADLENPEYWESETLTHLFRAKRCKLLANLLSIRKTFQETGLLHGTHEELTHALGFAKCRSAITQVVRMMKAEHVGVDMMDITVCGSVAPYNLLLGGKLVCMMLCSPQVTNYYAKRYYDQISVIASGMKGKPVRRKPNLVLLCTTSLYGVGSSQYNRLKIPADVAGGTAKDKVIYEDLGHSEGFGTYHFSKETLKLGSTLISRRKDGRLVNSIFGEGVNPLMRKVREALDIVELRSDELLLHGNRRITYGVSLAKNFKEVLLGLDSRPAYVIPQTMAHQRTDMIANYWRQRWLVTRLRKPDILDEVAKHRLTYPITHGAMVPRAGDITETGSLAMLWQSKSG